MHHNEGQVWSDCLLWVHEFGYHKEASSLYREAELTLWPKFWSYELADVVQGEYEQALLCDEWELPPEDQLMLNPLHIYETIVVDWISVINCLIRFTTYYPNWLINIKS